MEYVRCKLKHDYLTNYYRFEKAFNINDFPFQDLKAKRKGYSKYINEPATLDIETTTIKDTNASIKEGRDVYEAYMYHCQLCIEDKVLFIRTYTELQQVFTKLQEVYKLDRNNKLVCYVHNLSYEFQFLTDWFNTSEVFATDKHKVLRCIFNECIEMRCSYFLSNMNLKKFIENQQGTEHLKSSGDLDFRKIYTTESKLNYLEKGYCYNDVKGLSEAIKSIMTGYTLDNIPMTSTGFVRRDCRNAMRVNNANRKKFIKSKLQLEQYMLLKEAFRGGNTASNRYYANTIVNDVLSYDYSSSYPYVMLTERFPVGKFMYKTIASLSDLYIYNRKYATFAVYTFTDLKVKDGVGIPYLPFSKCRKVTKPLNYNGRILYAECVQIVLTNIDFEIINDQYTFSELYVEDFYYSYTDYLPKELRETILYYFDLKCRLKGNDAKIYEYMKSKNKLNGIYGMMVTDILRTTITFDQQTNEWGEIANNDIDKYYSSRNNFLTYQWGVWVTAYARANLEKAINKCGKHGIDVIYCDTDSVKFIGDHEQALLNLNNEIIRINEKNHIKHYVDIDGKRYYLGLLEKDNQYKEFKTMGAKKYAYTDYNDHLGVTVSGLSKTQGAKELREKGGLKAFTEGTTFYNSGRTVAYYNNAPIHTITVNGVQMLNASNIAIVDTTYTLGITDTMRSILLSCQNLL